MSRFTVFLKYAQPLNYLFSIYRSPSATTIPAIELTGKAVTICMRNQHAPASRVVGRSPVYSQHLRHALYRFRNHLEEFFLHEGTIFITPAKGRRPKAKPAVSATQQQAAPCSDMEWNGAASCGLSRVTCWLRLQGEEEGGFLGGSLDPEGLSRSPGLRRWMKQPVVPAKSWKGCSSL